MSLLPDVAVHLRMWAAGWLLWRPFIRRTRCPTRTQQRVLRSILRRNRDTDFGRQHQFPSIRTANDFSRRVPILTYEDLRPYIERQETQQTAGLLPEQPLMYARTSGTTGQAKHLPVTAATIARAKRNQRIFSYCHYSAIPGIFGGKTLAFVSPAIEGRLPSGTPYGSMSGLIYENMPRLLRRRYLVPPAVFAINDHALKYLLIAIFAVAERAISFIAGANPSTFLKVSEVIRSRSAEIVFAIETGVLPGRDVLGLQAHGEIQRCFRSNPDRASTVKRLFEAGPEVTFSLLWPELKAVSCWREGGSRGLLPALERQLSPGVATIELGYLASELRGSLPVDSGRRLEVPTLHENYFEFVERGDWEAGRRETLLLAELEAGRSYYVIVTTPDGLYRYFMNDVVRVDGRFNGTPTIKFLEKGAGATSITGEKLYESQVCEAMEALEKAGGWTSPFFLLVAEPEHMNYRLYLECPAGRMPGGIAGQLDAGLAARNLEYQTKRASGRLGPVELTLVAPGTGEAWKTDLVAGGQREAQFKFARLLPRHKVTFDFNARCVADQ